MNESITCPACEGRGTYCLRVLDPVWSELTTTDNSCELCNGRGKIAFDEVEPYYPEDRRPYFPYNPFDH